MTQFIAMLEVLFTQNGIEYCIVYDPQQGVYHLSYDGLEIKITEE